MVLAVARLPSGPASAKSLYLLDPLISSNGLILATAIKWVWTKPQRVIRRTLHGRAEMTERGPTEATETRAILNRPRPQIAATEARF